MSLLLALKSFWKAIQEPEKAQQFLQKSTQGQKQVHQDTTEHSHLKLLMLLQQSSRLIDFFKEDISNYTDEQVGSAVRKIHQDCNQSLEELVTIRSIMDENEGSSIEVPVGYDPSTIKLSGNIKGEPPFKGILVHKGWKAHKRSLPKRVGEQAVDVISPAEIEVR